MSFRLKTLLGIAFIQAVLLLAMIASSLDFLRTSNEDELQKRARATAQLFASTTRDAVLATDLASLESAVAAVLSNPDMVYARVSGSRGVLAQGGEPAALARPFRADARIALVRDGIFDAGADIVVQGVAYGRVEVGLSTASISNVLSEARTQIMSIAAAGIGLVALFSYFLGLYLTRGLDTLKEGTRRLAAGELGYQVEVRGTDELAKAASAFNGMSRELLIASEERQHAERELTHYQEHLEQIVRQRTEELTRNNETLKNTNRKLEEAHNQLIQAEKMASIGQLAAGMAHEINNPVGFVQSNLGSMEGYLRSLIMVIDAYERNAAALAGYPEFQECRETIEAVKREVDLDYLKQDAFSLLDESRAGLQRVAKIVHDLKDFSRVGESEWQYADLHRGLDSTLNVVGNDLRQKAEVVKRYGDLPEIECLPAELNQAFANLLINAAHAIEGRGQITIATGVQDDEVWVEVRDTGKGIAPQHLTRIFDPFFTTKPVGKGIGLGLSLTYSIIKKHHGRIEVASEEGKGAAFRVYLPLHQHGAVEDGSRHPVAGEPMDTKFT